MIYYCAIGEPSQIQRIDASLDGSPEVVADVPLIPPNVAAGPNDLTFNIHDDLFFSDSFQGAIFRIEDPANNCPGCLVIPVIQDDLLATVGFPPFGANGIAISPSDENQLFVANTGDDTVLRLNLPSDLTVFANSLNGADGLAFDESGRLWVAANQADEMVVLNVTNTGGPEDGRVVAKFGDFLGVRNDGAVKGLSFPVSLAIDNGWVFVTNLALNADGKGVEGDITTYTVSRIKVR